MFWAAPSTWRRSRRSRAAGSSGCSRTPARRWASPGTARRVGSFGHLASFSFYFSHHITTIEGGMVVTNDARLADLLRAMRAHGWVRDMQARKEIAAGYPHIDPRFLFLTTGFNVRPTEINAAIGLEQLKKLPAFNESRREIARRLDAGLAALDQAGDIIAHTARSARHARAVRLQVLCRSREARDGLRDHLEAAGRRNPAGHLRKSHPPARARPSRLSHQRRACRRRPRHGLRHLLGHPPVHDRGRRRPHRRDGQAVLLTNGSGRAAAPAWLRSRRSPLTPLRHARLNVTALSRRCP